MEGKNKPIVLGSIVATALLVIGAGAYFFGGDFSKISSSLGGLGGAVTPSKLLGSEEYAGAPLSAEYRNEQFGFSLAVPEGFNAGELPGEVEGGQTIILQNEKGEGIQILVSPFSEDLKVLTGARIQQDIPDMQIREAQEITIGPEYTGVAFLSDNDAFGGASREVWFVFRGTLYQISTYTRLDPLLKAMFATWKFF